MKCTKIFREIYPLVDFKAFGVKSILQKSQMMGFGGTIVTRVFRYDSHDGPKSALYWKYVVGFLRVLQFLSMAMGNEDKLSWVYPLTDSSTVYGVYSYSCAPFNIALSSGCRLSFACGALHISVCYAGYGQVDLSAASKDD
jgi:hypothetical protein